MANSLSEWLVDKISSCIASSDAGVDLHQQDRQNLLGDISYEKGLAVQILHFFTPKLARQAHQELLQSYHSGMGSGQSSQYSSTSMNAAASSSSTHIDDNAGPLCAIVADKAHRVHIQFSKHCVARFDSTHARPLISLRGSLIHIKSFRPSISFLPSFLDNVRFRDDQFALESPTIKPTLFLEVESMQVLGAINEVQFWDDKDLESILLDPNTPATPFKNWFKQVAKVMMKEQRKRKGNTEGEAIERKSAKLSSKSESFPDKTVSIPMPPPFQRPVDRNKKKDASQGSSLTSSKNTREDSLRGSWGDFTLTQGDDEFGLEAAASQLIETIERQEQGMDNLEGHLTADSLDTHATFPSLCNDEVDLGKSNKMQDEEPQSIRVDGDSSQSQSSRERLSQSSTVPATYPVGSTYKEEKKILEKNRGQDSNIYPPSVTDSTSLPFTLEVDTDSSKDIAKDSKKDDLRSERKKEEQSKSIKEPSPQSVETKSIDARAKKRVEMADKATMAKPFVKVYRAPSAEVQRARDEKLYHRLKYEITGSD